MRKEQIPVDELKFGMYVLELDRPWVDTPFLFQGFPIASQEQIDELKKHCHSVFVDAERQTYDVSTRSTPGEFPEHPLPREKIAYSNPTPFAEELHVAKDVYLECVKSVGKAVEHAYRTGELDPQELAGAVNKMTRSIERNPDALMLLNRIREQDNSEFNSAINNSVYMITFGRFLNFPGDRLEQLGLAGLLFDIGKVRLPQSILHREDRLTAEEYEMSKKHVAHSIQFISEHPTLPVAVTEIVAQHHERLDGSGYPNGLSGKQITIEGAIAGLVNSYCALISRRGYAEQFSPSTALNMLFKLRGTLYHSALTEQLLQCIGIYPVGSTVELNTGEIGIVISQNLVRRLQPRVMIILDSSWKPAKPYLTIDLIKDSKSESGDTYRIKRSIPANQLPIVLDDFFLSGIS